MLLPKLSLTYRLHHSANSVLILRDFHAALSSLVGHIQQILHHHFPAYALPLPAPALPACPRMQFPPPILSSCSMDEMGQTKHPCFSILHVCLLNNVPLLLAWTYSWVRCICYRWLQMQSRRLPAQSRSRPFFALLPTLLHSRCAPNVAGGLSLSLPKSWFSSYVALGRQMHVSVAEVRCLCILR